MYSDTLEGIFIVFFPLICITVIVLRLVRPQKNRCNNLFVLVCFFVLGWYACEFARFISDSALVFSFSMRLGLVFMEFSAVTTLFFIISFYRQSFKPPRKLHLFLYVIPFFTTLFAFVPRFWPLIYDEDFIPAKLSVFYSSVAPWFWVHTFFCYAIVLLTIVVVLWGHFRIPRFYRFYSLLIVFAILLTPITHIISFTGHWYVPLPPLAFSLCITVVLGHIALLNSDMNVFIRHSRGHIFQYLEESILVLGEDGIIVDYNPKAADWFGTRGIDLVSSTLQNTLDKLILNGAEIKEGPDNHDETDISFYNGTFFEVLSLRVHEIIDRKNRKIGAIAIFTDVTKNRDLFKRLEEKAGMDPLTGLANRMAYEGARNRLDAPEYYPLSLILCDVNGLKGVNDTLGHEYGDKMLQTIAEALETACPNLGFVARIGGDEFIYLLPNTNQAAAQEVVEQIRKMLMDRKNLPFGLSVACGTATIYSEKEDLDSLINLADARMYEDKKQFKGDKKQYREAIVNGEENI